MSIKVVTVVGARPQFIKASPVSFAFKTCQINEIMVHTGQHYDDNMSEVFFSELGIPAPHYNLNIGSNSHGKQTGMMLAAIEEVLFQEKPQWVLIYGDTNSTLAGALAAAKLNIPIAHVEAGLRSFNRRMPEEINRVMSDHLSTLLFAPTLTSVANLLKEGIDEKRILHSGDVMYDAALFHAKQSDQNSTIISDLNLAPKQFALATLHRAENTDSLQRLKAIIEALCKFSEKTEVLFPLHPRTKDYLKKYALYETAQKHLKIIEPVGLLDMIQLEKNASLIVTDSGGIQKEAYFYRTPCVTLRDETEWIELIELGWNRLATPISAEHIVSILNLATSPLEDQNEKPYGNGDTASFVAKQLIEKTII